VLERHTIPIGEVYSGMYDGPHATPNPSESGPIFLGIKNVGESGQLDFSDVRHISEEEYSRWVRRIEPKYGDIVFSYEATLNRYAMIPKGFRGCLGRRMALIRPDESKACGRFLYYYFYGHEWRNVIAQNTLVGSTVDRIPIAKFPDFPVNIPSLPTQRKIAAILSAYDDLIENNLRRIRILADMVQNLYREWFVKLRFPGSETCHFVDSPIGRIPEGWTVTPIVGIGELTVGGDWGAGESSGPDSVQAACLRGVDLHNLQTTGEGEPVVRWVSKSSLAKRCVLPTDVVVEGSGECGRSLHGYRGLEDSLGYTVIYSNFCKRLRFGKPAIAQYVAQVLNEMVETGAIRQYRTGTAIPNLNVTALVEKHLLLLPPEELLAQFDELAGLAEGFRLRGHNRSLRRTRDLLLPRLISGELDVSELDIAVPEEAGA